MSAKTTGFLRRAWAPRDFEAAIIADVRKAPRLQLERAYLLQKVVLLAVEEFLVKVAASDGGGSSAMRAALLNLSRINEAAPSDVMPCPKVEEAS